MTRGQAITIHWFRRDLRLEDDHGLHAALTQHGNVLPLFIFDTHILDRLEDRDDRRVDLIHRTITTLRERLEAAGGTLLVAHGDPLAVWQRLLDELPVKAVTFNHDHEPYACERDARIVALLHERGIPCHSYKDISLFERDEVMKDDGGPYTVFTPYGRKWRSLLRTEMMAPFPSERHLDKLYRWTAPPLPSLRDLGFVPTDVQPPPNEVSSALLAHYANTRNLPGIEGTSRMSVALRFGTVSPRALMRQAFAQSDAFANELIWREFFMQVLWHFPQVVDQAFKPAYDRIAWRNNESEFAAWCEGRTGYPLVDAGMRELLATGLMHNRVRMVVASFLTKHLLIDRRWGEAHFARYLLDFELSSNNGNWQWAAGSGCDAAPYFRVFNPALQTARFDPQLTYVKRWVPEHGTANYPRPIVVHEQARARALAAYKAALGEATAGSERPQLFEPWPGRKN